MHRIIRPCLPVMTVAALFVGCVDQESADRAAALKQLSEAVGLVARSQGRPADANQDVAAYRVKQLRDAVTAIEACMPRLSPQDALSARRLLASVHMSIAREEAGKADNQWAGLSGRTGNLLAAFSGVVTADTLARSFNVDESPLLGTLRQFKEQTLPQIAQAQATAEDLNKKIAKLTAEREQLVKTAQTALAAADAMAQKSMAVSGAESVELSLKSIESRRKSEQAAAAAEALDSRLEVIESERDVAKARGKLAGEVVTYIDEQSAAAETRQTTAQQEREKALGTGASPSEGSKAAMLKQLDAGFAQMSGDFEKQVAEPYAAAIAAMDKALAALKQASEAVSDDARREIQSELLGAQSLMAQIRASQIRAVAGFAQTLTAIAQRAQAVLPERASAFSATAASITERQQKQVTEAMAVIDAADQLAGQLAGGGASSDPVAAMAANQGRLLQGYRRQINIAIGVERYEPTPDPVPAAPSSDAAPAPAADAPAADAAPAPEAAPAEAAPAPAAAPTE